MGTAQIQLQIIERRRNYKHFSYLAVYINFVLVYSIQKMRI